MFGHLSHDDSSCTIKKHGSCRYTCLTAIIIFLSIASLSSVHAIVLNRDPGNPSFNDNETFKDNGTMKDNADSNREDKGAVEKEKNKPVQLKDKYKFVIFNFENLTGNMKYNYLVNMIAPHLQKELNSTSKFSVEHAEINFASVKIDDYANYIKLLNKTAASYNTDYLCTGFTHNVDRGVSIEALVYITRLNTMLKINVTRDDFGPNFKDIIEELAKKILDEIYKDVLQLQKDQEHQEKIGERFSKNTYFGMAGYFGFWYIPNGSSLGFAGGLNKILTFEFYWELAHIKKIRDIKGARDLAIFGLVDIGKTDSPVTKDIVAGSSAAGSYNFGLWGGVVGLMYKFKIIQYFSIDVGAGYGGVYTQTSLPTSYTSSLNFIVPPKAYNKSSDHYFNMLMFLNAIVNPYFFFSVGVTYKLIGYTANPVNIIVGYIGIGIKF
jgi:TolB-like protein